ncbi:MAG: hypothetical protein HY901_38240 [Deltaproteobacteria bacterium]|nr:hypothetical protein [Deltaproteobacteria bacterium]
MSAWTRLAVAAALWIAVGLGLESAGLWWCHSAPPSVLVVGLLVAGGAGWLKGHFLLGKVAMRNAARIEGRGNRRCVFGFLSPAGWAVLPLMMGVGAMLRHSPIPRVWLGFIYVGLGTAMLVGASPLARHLLTPHEP